MKKMKKSEISVDNLMIKIYDIFIKIERKNINNFYTVEKKVEKKVEKSG